MKFMSLDWCASFLRLPLTDDDREKIKRFMRKELLLMMMMMIIVKGRKKSDCRSQSVIQAVAKFFKQIRIQKKNAQDCKENFF
jgi:hypothetical protein